MNNDFEYFIHAGRVLKRGVEAGGSPLHIKTCYNSITVIKLIKLLFNPLLLSFKFN